MVQKEQMATGRLSPNTLILLKKQGVIQKI